MSKTTTRTTTMNLRLDEETRRQLQAFADKLGIPASTLAVANIKQMLREGELRLAPTLEPTPYLEKIMREADEDIKAGRTMGPFDSVEAMLADLEK